MGNDLAAESMLAAPGRSGFLARSARPVPLRTMLALGAVVLALHVLLLKAAPGAISLEKPPTVRGLVTRTIEINRPAAAAPEPTFTPPVPVAGPAAPAAHRAAAAPQPPPQPAPAPSSAPPQTQAAGAVPAPPETMPPAAAQASAPAAAAAAPPAAASHAEAAAMAAPSPPARRDDGPRATAFSIPGSVRLSYNVTGEVKKQNWNARGELLWRHDGMQYEARSQYSVFMLGSRSQTSTGRIGADGLAPTRFSDKGKTELAAHFDRDKARVVFSANTPEVPLLAGAQDRLSVVLQLGAMIAGEPAKYPPGTAITLQTVGAREADGWLFTVDGEEKLALAEGETTALKLTRAPRREFDIKLELWLAPSLGYLPARMRLTQPNGDFVDQQLRSADRP